MKKLNVLNYIHFWAVLWPHPTSPGMHHAPTVKNVSTNPLLQVQYVPEHDAQLPEDGASSHQITQHPPSHSRHIDLRRGRDREAERLGCYTHLASHWDLLSGCLEAAWAYWPHLRHMPREAWLSHQMRTSVWWHNWPCCLQIHIDINPTAFITFKCSVKEWLARIQMINMSFCFEPAFPFYMNHMYLYYIHSELRNVIADKWMPCDHERINSQIKFGHFPLS